MKKIRLGVIGTADIAFRRFLPALMKMEEIEYIGIASRDIRRTSKFVETYGGKGFESYEAMIQSDEIDAIYMPLPPALHFKWGKMALENNKHLLLEKPFTTSMNDTNELIKIAREKNLAIHENYMFQYHEQFRYIKEILEREILGELRLLRIAFGFPKREKSDFRYNRVLGGGALLDCGGYTLKLASLLLGNNLKVTTAVLDESNSYGVDLYGSATMINECNKVAQLAFGMDNAYKCELEIWGSKGILLAPRIFTAPADYDVVISCKIGDSEEKIEIGSDDQFLNSIRYFYSCIAHKNNRELSYQTICNQARLVEGVKQVGEVIDRRRE